MHHSRAFQTAVNYIVFPISFQYFFLSFYSLSSEDSFHSLPTSYQVLTSSKDNSKGLNLNVGRGDRVLLSPFLKAFPYNQNWQQYPSSDSNLPRYRRDVLKETVEIPKIQTNVNGSSNVSDISEENRKTIS